MEKGRDCPPVCVNGNVLVRHRWQDGWVKKEVRPGGGGKKDKRERRRCAQRRRWKTPQKAASDEPFGKHCFGDRARYRWPGGRVKEEARLGRAGKCGKG